MKRIISLILIFVVIITSIYSVSAVTVGDEKYNLFLGSYMTPDTYFEYLADLKKERGTEYSEEELTDIYNRIMYFVINRRAIDTNDEVFKTLLDSILFVNIRNDNVLNCVEVVVGDLNDKQTEKFKEYICDSDAVVLWCYPSANAPSSDPRGYAGIAVNLKASPAWIKTDAGEGKEVPVANRDKVQLWKSSDPKIINVKNGKVTALRKGKAIVTAVYSSAVEVSVRYEVKTDPELTFNGKSVSSITVKRKKTKTLKLSGKAAMVKNKYKNTKKAKIISKANSTAIKIKGLKKGNTTLSITVNNSKVLKIKVKVK